MTTFTESVIEDAALDWFAELGHTVAHGPDPARSEAASERASYGEVVLIDRLRSALNRINPKIPAEAIDDVQCDALLPKLLSGENRGVGVTLVIAQGEDKPCPYR